VSESGGVLDAGWADAACSQHPLWTTTKSTYLELMVGNESSMFELELKLVRAFLLRCHSATLATRLLTCCFISGVASDTCCNHGQE
jgi:hypothetical protein